MNPRRIVLVPGTLALLPAYAGLDDPVAPLRAACRAAVGWLIAEGGPVTVSAGTDSGMRVGRHLLAESGGIAGDSGAGGLLIVANGSASRTEKAPGHLHPAAAGFDAALDGSLRTADVAGLRALDLALAAALWADVGALVSAAEAFAGARLVAADYADDPYGVLYRVMRWEVP